MPTWDLSPEEKLALLVRLREELHFEKRYAEVISRSLLLSSLELSDTQSL